MKRRNCVYGIKTTRRVCMSTCAVLQTKTLVCVRICLNTPTLTLHAMRICTRHVYCVLSRRLIVEHITRNLLLVDNIILDSNRARLRTTCHTWLKCAGVRRYQTGHEMRLQYWPIHVGWVMRILAGVPQAARPLFLRWCW